jgi:uncharacterized MnhB-related membrane protein
VVITSLLVVASLVCAVCALYARRLLHMALWLAGVSACVSLLLYGAGAREVAIIELSVGAGLVFILFVFAISLAGEARPPEAAVVSGPPAAVLLGLVVILLGELAWPHAAGASTATLAPLSLSLWSERRLDVLLQVVLIFCGALTIAGLLAPAALEAAHAAQAAGEAAPLACPPLAGPASAVADPVEDHDHALLEVRP